MDASLPRHAHGGEVRRAITRRDRRVAPGVEIDGSAPGREARTSLAAALPVVVLTAGVAVVAGMHAVLLRPLWRDYPIAAAMNLLTAAALLVAGAALLRHARRVRLGWVLVALAATWLMVDAGVGHAGSAPLVSFVSSQAVVVLLVLAMASYPADVPWSRSRKVFLAAAVVVLGAGTAAMVGFGRPGWFASGTAWWPGGHGAAVLTASTARVAALLQVATVVATTVVLWPRSGSIRRIGQLTLVPAAAAVLVSCMLAACTTAAEGRALTARGWVTASCVQGVWLLVLPGCVGWAWWRTRQLRARIAGLVHDLRTVHSAVEVRRTLREHLGDPTVEVLYRVQGYRVHEYRVQGPAVYVDGGGLPLDEEITAGRLNVRVHGRLPDGQGGPAGAGTELALVSVSAHLRPYEDYVTAAVRAAGFVLDNIRLRAQLRARLEEVDRSLGQVLAAEEEELRAFALEHGDDLQQRLLGLAMRAEAARVLVTEPRYDEDWALLAATATRAGAEAAAIARGVYAPHLGSGGLRRALEELTDHPGLLVDLDVAEGGDLHTQRAAYLCLSEALSNVVKHAGATRVWITVRGEGSGLRLVVRDDGVGGVRRDGDILTSLRSRAALAGGDVTVSSPAGEGTTITMHLPGVDNATAR